MRTEITEGGYVHENRYVRVVQHPKPKQLVAMKSAGEDLWAEFSDGSRHKVRPEVHGKDVVLGCVKTTREALRLIQVAIEKEDKFQAENAERLMKQVAKGRKKVKA